MRCLILIASLALSACATITPDTRTVQCGADGEARSVATLFRPQYRAGPWRQRRELTRFRRPRSHAALRRWYDAQGQWRDSDTGAIVREPSKVLMLILSDESRDRAAIQTIAEAYKARFQQQAVAVVLKRECVAFR